MKKLFTTCIALMLVLCLHEAKAQIGINTMNPDTNAVLDIQSKDKGIKLPSIPQTVVLKVPQDSSGYLIYHSTDKKFRYWNTKIWESVNPFTADEKNETITAPKDLNVTGTATANNFVGYGTIPMGGIIMWSGTIDKIPDGWALCDGTNGTPNLSGRFIAGYSNTTEYSIGVHNDGKDFLTLTNDNLPAHSHGSGSLVTEKNGIHSHSHQGNRAVDNGGGENVKSREKLTSDPIDYGGEPAGEHTHGIIGNTDTTGGIYTFETYPNPELLNPAEKCFLYKILISGKTYYVDKDEMGGYNDGPEIYCYAEKDPSYSGPFNKYKIYIKNTTSNIISSIPVSFISNYSEYSFSLNGIIPTDNPSYDPKTPYINPLHIAGKAINEIIVHKRKWAVQPIDNRPSYYVLAFIMRIK